MFVSSDNKEMKVSKADSMGTGTLQLQEQQKKV
jgi:hypothetical protein